METANGIAAAALILSDPLWFIVKPNYSEVKCYRLNKIEFLNLVQVFEGVLGFSLSRVFPVSKLTFTKSSSCKL